MTSTEAVAAQVAERQRAGRGRLDKRLAILSAAAEVFAEQGYERASIDAIAARSGVSKPTIYNHFGAKDQLFRESVAQSAAQLNTESMAALATMDVRPGVWRASLHQVALALVGCQRSSCARSLQQQMNAEINRDPDLIRAVRARAATPLVEALAGRLAMLGNAGLIRVPDPTLAAHQFLALIAAELPQLAENGSADMSETRVRDAVDAGVDTFVRAHRPD